MPQPGHDQHRQPDDDGCWHEPPGVQRGHQCRPPGRQLLQALTALRPACPARAGSGSSPRPPHHGAQLGDLVHAERDHPALVGSVRPHPDEQTRRAVIAGVLPHRDVARDPLVTDWLARLALPVRAVIIQLWSLAVLDQLRLVRSRRLVFAGHDGVRAMCAPAQQSCEADGSPRRSVCRVTPTAHTTNDQPCRGEQESRFTCVWTGRRARSTPRGTETSVSSNGSLMVFGCPPGHASSNP